MFGQELFDSYDSFKIAGITSSRFSQEEMLSWFRPFDDGNFFKKTVLGNSAEGRIISLYTFGDGQIKAILWSQMHGDEPTATMALADIISFFAKNPEHAVTKKIRENLSLLIIPMLNPDGAERFTRRTAQLIDMNRDALAMETPEARILREVCSKYRPDFGFNLHDQDPRYTVGTTKKNTAIALLAPSTDESRTDNAARIKSKKVATILAQTLNQFIPGYVAKWDDTFVPNAFGENIQKWGTSTVLIESGGWRSDPDKFFIRKLNYIGLLSALYAIATEEVDKTDTTVYEQIPFNMKLGFDLIIRNASYKANNQVAPIRVDIGINFESRRNNVTGQLEQFAAIMEIGDLDTFAALEKEEDAGGDELDADRIKIDCLFPSAEVPLLFKRKKNE